MPTNDGETVLLTIFIVVVVVIIAALRVNSKAGPGSGNRLSLALRHGNTALRVQCPRRGAEVDLGVSVAVYRHHLSSLADHLYSGRQ